MSCWIDPPLFFLKKSYIADMKKQLLIFILLFVSHQAAAQLINADLFRLRHQWGYFDFERANTARFSMYMLRAQKRTMLYMNLARQMAKNLQSL